MEVINAKEVQNAMDKAHIVVCIQAVVDYWDKVNKEDGNKVLYNLDAKAGDSWRVIDLGIDAIIDFEIVEPCAYDKESGDFEDAKVKISYMCINCFEYRANSLKSDTTILDFVNGFMRYALDKYSNNYPVILIEFERKYDKNKVCFRLYETHVPISFEEEDLQDIDYFNEGMEYLKAVLDEYMGLTHND